MDPILEVWRWDDPARRAACFKVFNEDQIGLWAIWQIDGQIDNGGVVQAISNSDGELCEEAVQGFRRFGLIDHAELLDEALSLFERPIPLDREDRHRMLERATGVDADLYDPASASKLFMAGSDLTKDVNDRYFTLKKTIYGRDMNLLQDLSQIIEKRKDSFFKLD